MLRITLCLLVLVPASLVASAERETNWNDDEAVMITTVIGRGENAAAGEKG